MAVTEYTYQINADSKKTYATQGTNFVLDSNIIDQEVQSTDLGMPPQSMQTKRTQPMKISKGVEGSGIGSQETVTPFTIRTENKGDSKIFGKEQGGLNSSQFSLSRT